MKKIISVLLILFCFLVFLFFEYKKEKTYKILEVLEGDKLCIDLNANGKKDEDEIFHLKNINTFPLKYSSKGEEYAKRYGITIEEENILGYIAKKYTESLLKDKEIRFLNKIEPYNSKYPYRFAEVEFEGKNINAHLLEAGLAFAYEGAEFNPYKVYENLPKIKENLKKYSRLKLYLLDKKYKIYHKTSCIHTLKIKEYEIIKEEKLPKDFKKCKYCFSDDFKAKTAVKPAFSKASLYRVFNNVSIFLLNPYEFNKPSNSCRTKACKLLLENINSSKNTIDFALYGIDRQNEILEALSAAQKRGVKIRGVVDSKADGSYVYSDTARLKEKFGAILDLKNQNMHNKFFIFDNKKVFTGTMNISTTGSGGYNANTAVFINDARVAELYTKEFNQMYEGRFQYLKENYSKSLQLNSDTKLSVYFSPKGSAYGAISGLLKGAKKEIYVSIFYLTHKGIIQDLINAKKRGVDVRIIYDAVGANNMKAQVKLLRDFGVKLKVENWGGKDHEKNMVIDGKIFITGSANFSNSGMDKNDENILIFENSVMAGFCRGYFLNLYNLIDDKYLKRTPRAESFESGNSCFDGLDNNFDGSIDGKDAGCIR